MSPAVRGPDRSLTALLATDDRLARATWSRLAEPADKGAVELVARYGAGPALEVVLGRGDPAHERFRSRLPALDPRPALDLVHRMGGRLVCPDDAEWPRRFSELPAPPFCLWVRGPLDIGAACERSVAVVGSRAATAYGQDVAHEIADGVAERGFTVVSGGALGIDGFAHAAALRAAGRTIAVLAGGIDRPYPRAHEDLIAEVAEVGAVVSEVPPGSAPTRGRFIQRNRMIATMSAGTVVVEAAVRSGALNTARTALSHQRPVGAVPGPVTSLVSAGCHQLLREGQAVLVCDAAQVAEHVGPIGEHLAPMPSGPAREDWDELEPDEQRVLEALPRSRGSSPEKVAAVAGLEPAVVRSVLGRLALRDLARRDTAGWRRGALRGSRG